MPTHTEKPISEIPPEPKSLGAVAVLGPAGTFSHQCANLKYPQYSPYFCKTLPEVLEAVRHRDSDFALVPLENSNSGSIKEIHRELFSLAGQLVVIEFVPHHIEQHLFSFEDSIESIIEVSSKDAALAQCKEWLEHYLPKARRIPTTSTTAAVVALKDRRPGAAALGSNDCQAHGIPKLVSSVQSEPNITLFGKIARELPNEIAGKARFALLAIPDSNNDKFEKLLETMASVAGCSITHTWMIEDMEECPPNTEIFEIGFSETSGIFPALMASVKHLLPEAFLVGAYNSIGFSEFSLLKHQPYAPSNFEY